MKEHTYCICPFGLKDVPEAFHSAFTYCASRGGFEFSFHTEHLLTE